MDKSTIEKDKYRLQNISEIRTNIKNALVWLKTDAYKDRDSLTIGILEQDLSIRIPRELEKSDINRLSEIIYEGFRTFKLNPYKGKYVPLILEGNPPLIEALDNGIESANILDQQVLLVTNKGEKSFLIPTGLNNGSDNLILADALDKGLKVNGYLPEDD